MKIVKALPTTLYSPLSASGTSIVLKKFVDLDGNELAMSDFGDWGVVVIKQGDSVEMIKFSGLTQSSTDTTCTLTVASSGRSIAGTSPYAGASTGIDFNAGAEVIVSNDPLTLSRFANLDIAQTFEKVMTFTLSPVVPTPTNDTDVANKAYVNSIALGTLTTINVIVPGTAGETIANGNLVYYDDTANQWKLTDADTAATVDNVLLGIAQGAGTVGVAITDGVLLQGVDNAQSGLTIGQTYYASNTAGGIATSAGTTSVIVGIGKSATELYFAPRFNSLLTANQLAALAGTSGTPSSSNKYVTDADTTGTGAVVRASATPALIDIQTFTVDGTWTKPTGAKTVEVIVIGAGGSGAGGAGSGGAGTGGAGGAGAAGGYGKKTINAAGLGATESVVVGVASAGGAAGGVGANGTDGTAGTASSFGTTVLVKATGGGPGIKGLTGGTAVGASGTPGTANGDYHADGGAIAANTAVDLSPRSGGAGSAGYGSASAGVANPTPGTAGGGFITTYVNAGGAANGGAGNSISSSLLIGGTGGGGATGGASGQAPTVAGGAGGTYGAGGGGGGGGGYANGPITAAGSAGGAGAAGLVVVITYF